jgi:hypothetical protein
MPYLNCPRCDLTLLAKAGDGGVEECPRCLARTRGVLSIPMGPGSSTERAPTPSKVARLIQRLRYALHFQARTPSLE